MDLQFFGRIHIIFIIFVHLVLILQTTSLEDRQHSSLKERRSGLKDRRSNLENLKSDRQRILDELTELEGQYKSRVACTRHALKAQKWMGETDQQLGEKLHDLILLSWNYITNMNEDTLKKLEDYQNSLDDWMYVELQNARMYLLEEEQVRKCNRTTWRLLNLFINFPNVPLADDPETRKQINHLGNKMDELTATAKVDRDGKVYRLDPELNDILTNSRDYDELLWAWEAWHNSSRPIKPVYIEFIDKVNEAARDNRFDNLGISWQLTDFQETDVESMMDDLLEELRPFYEQLHSFVRQRLILAYPDKKIDPQGPIPVHLLGNMFAQEWTNIIDLLMPYPDVPAIDVTKALKEQNYTPLKMFKLAEEFFTSIGLEPMTSDFWDKSIIVRPVGNISIECHASAEDFLSETDFRIKMCTSVIDNDLWTVHHEMGHIEYFMQYRHQAALFRTGANAAFHEAIGDTIALSAMTTKHLKTIGLSSRVRRPRGSQNTEYKQKINFLMAMALTKVAFIPFGYVVDKWRYQVFRGDITPDQYNTKWWELRERYQGVVPPVPRPDTEFDPGAKHHIPANVPYSRYFFSFFGQFQFQSALCKAAQHNGSLSDCDIYRSTEAGSLLKSVLELGASKPWPDVMQKFTGQRKFKADALLEYFAPLREWLENENKGQPVGWTTDDVQRRLIST